MDTQLTSTAATTVMSTVYNPTTTQATDYSATLSTKAITEQSTTAYIDTFTKSTSTNTEKATYEKPKKLTQEEIQALQDSERTAKRQFLRKMMMANSIAQISHDSIRSNSVSTELLQKVFSSTDVALPELATTSEGAEAAISEGGAYSASSVADRIMKMAEALSGDDLETLSQMKSAVEKGFSLAASSFKSATGLSTLPQICQDTYAAIMSHFTQLELTLAA